METTISNPKEYKTSNFSAPRNSILNRTNKSQTKSKSRIDTGLRPKKKKNPHLLDLNQSLSKIPNSMNVSPKREQQIQFNPSALSKINEPENSRNVGSIVVNYKSHGQKQQKPAIVPKIKHFQTLIQPPKQPV